MRHETIGNTRVAFYEGPAIATEAAALDAMGETYGQEVDLLAFPVELLVDDFFWLSTGLAGAVLQKLTNYGFRVAIVGDIGRFTAESPSLRDFVYESNKVGRVLFVPDRVALEARL